MEGSSIIKEVYTLMPQDFLSLSDFARSIGDELQAAFPRTYWVLAETSDVRHNRSGHCYLELIEKAEASETILARMRAYIWSSTFQMLKPYFEAQTGRQFTSGLRVLVKVELNFHPAYGLGLNIVDIDPTYTLGDIQQRRQEILRRLEEEGVLTLNKELELGLTPQRIAVISSPQAAGYEDFLNHLENNRFGFVFRPRLFPATMQGEATEASIIQALEAVFHEQDLFDVVVIIRGGGASSDLAAFDSYNLAAHCAQFPLPIITGIGHERDNTVLDYVSFHRAKTPTAVADFLIHHIEETYEELQASQAAIMQGVRDRLVSSRDQLERVAYQLPLLLKSRLEAESRNLESTYSHISASTRHLLQDKERQLREKEAFFKLSSPAYILSRGYSITYKDGRAIKSAADLAEGDEIRTIFHEGETTSSVL